MASLTRWAAKAGRTVGPRKRRPAQTREEFALERDAAGSVGTTSCSETPKVRRLLHELDLAENPGALVAD
jgi:hypothetical protein